jgi:hypothetical protein
MTKPAKNVYKVLFHSQGKVYELYAGHVRQGDLYGFIEVEELAFGEQSGLLVNPAEERLQAEFAGVRRTFIPLHAVIRIDEVEKEGISKIRSSSDSADNIAPFPGPLYPPGGRKDKE